MRKAMPCGIVGVIAVKKLLLTAIYYVRGNTKSCGCLRRERGREAMKTNISLIANRGTLATLKHVMKS